MVNVIVNESGDYVIVESTDGNRVYEGHSIHPFDLVGILVRLGINSEYIVLTDDNMEEIC